MTFRLKNNPSRKIPYPVEFDETLRFWYPRVACDAWIDFSSRTVEIRPSEYRENLHSCFSLSTRFHLFLSCWPFPFLFFLGFYFSLFYLSIKFPFFSFCSHPHLFIFSFSLFFIFSFLSFFFFIFSFGLV